MVNEAESDAAAAVNAASTDSQEKTGVVLTETT
jgi:hypothetical protein